MPLLRRPREQTFLTLPSRHGMLAAETDVVIVGGGPSGIGAALGAAQAGARVVLAERYGFLGGNATAALVMPLMSFHTRGAPRPGQPVRSLMPADHGPGAPIVAGALRTLLERLVSSGGAIPPSEETGFVVPFDPEIFKLVAIDLLDEAGVEILFHSFASGVIGSGRFDGVVFETKSGPVIVKEIGRAHV